MKACDLARRLGSDLLGDPEVEILGVAPLHAASPTDLSFLSNPKYRGQALASRAGAVIVPEGEILPGRTLLPCSNPYAAFARAMQIFHPPAAVEPGIHPTAVVGEGCTVEPTASIGAFVVLGRGARVGARTCVGPSAVIGERCTIGTDCRIYPRVVLYDEVEVGDRVILHAGCVIGSDGFGYAQERGSHIKIPQVGRVVIGADVEIGANTTVDRGALDATRIGRGTKVDNLVQVGHNVEIGPCCILVAQSGVSGSTVLGESVVLAGQSGIVGHVRVGDGTRVGAKSAVTKSLPPGSFVTGHPAQDHRSWLRERALAGRLEEILSRLQRLESKLAPMEKEPADD